MDEVLVSADHEGDLKTLRKMNEVDHKIIHCAIVLIQNTSHIQMCKKLDNKNKK